MKILTWNLERPAPNSPKTKSIIDQLKSLNADIIVLTETATHIDLGADYHVIHSEKDTDKSFKENERRVSIFSKYPVTETIQTFRADTSVCVKVQTPKGDLIIYGTVIGVRGNRGFNFKEDLEQQLTDLEKLAAHDHVCFIGDLNVSFSDNYYFTTDARQKLNATFSKLNMINATENIKENIDHIVLSKSFIGDANITVHHWNDTADKNNRLSDHKGVCIEITG